MVDRQAVDQQRADSHLLEPPRRAPEEIALGRAPVLAEHPADAVPAAPEREPDRETRSRGAARRSRTISGSRTSVSVSSRIEIGRLLREHAARAARACRGAASELTSSEIANATAHSSDAAALLDRAAREPDAQARDVHPVRSLPAARALRAARARGRTGSTRYPSRSRCSPRRRSSGGRRGRPAAPGRAPTCPRAPGRASTPAPRRCELGGDAAVEHDAALRGEHLLELAVRSEAGVVARALCADALSLATPRSRGRAAAAPRSGSSA